MHVGEGIGRRPIVLSSLNSFSSRSYSLLNTPCKLEVKWGNENFCCASLRFWILDLKFWHVIWIKLKKTVEVGCKKKEKIDALFPTSSFCRNFGPAIGGQFFFDFFSCFFCIRLAICCWACFKSRVKISGPNYKNWAWYCDIVPLRASYPAQLVVQSKHYASVADSAVILPSTHSFS